MRLFTIYIVKKLLKLLKGNKYLCFLDFEGTQFSHEMIAFGAVFATIGKDLRIKRSKAPIKVFVKAKNKIGKYVEELTGIKQQELDKIGVPFSQAIQQLKKYCGLAFKKCTFVTFGNHDMRILSQSVSYNLDAPVELTKQISKFHFDFQAFVSEYIKDDNNNPLSLERYVEFFGVKFVGNPHDPKYDAINLMNIYDAFLSEKDLVTREYMKTLARDTRLPKPLRETLLKLTNGESVSPEEYEKAVKECLI